MKYLEIKDGKGYFKRGEEMLEIDQITADDLHSLINHAHEADFEIGEYDETQLPNKAQQIIYENIYLKLADFLANKEQFNEQANNMYVEAVGKYGADLETEPEPEVDGAEQEESENDDEIDPDDIPF
jgi:uncharacterized protein with gpF-like domain